MNHVLCSRCMHHIVNIHPVLLAVEHMRIFASRKGMAVDVTSRNCSPSSHSLHINREEISRWLW